jgi:hypothetical protein
MNGRFDGGSLKRLKAFLESRGADVKIIYLPSGEGGVKVGLDDFFAQGRTVDFDRIEPGRSTGRLSVTATQRIKARLKAGATAGREEIWM